MARYIVKEQGTSVSFGLNGTGRRVAGYRFWVIDTLGGRQRPVRSFAGEIRSAKDACKAQAEKFAAMLEERDA